MRHGSLVVLLAAGVGLGCASLALAQEQPKAKGVVAVRQLTMKANGDHMNAIKTILTEYPQAIAQVADHANAIAADARNTPALFPEGSDQQPTWALPVIWQKPDQFKAAAQRAQDLAQKLAETAKGGDAKATLAAFATLGKQGCGGCHDTFRKPES